MALAFSMRLLVKAAWHWHVHVQKLPSMFMFYNIHVQHEIGQLQLRTSLAPHRDFAFCILHLASAFTFTVQLLCNPRSEV
jgi:hypothetical protein